MGRFSSVLSASRTSRWTVERPTVDSCTSSGGVAGRAVVAGRVAATRVEMSAREHATTVSPKRRCSCPSRTTGASMRLPFTYVPLLEPRSWTTARPPGSPSRKACCLETFSSSRTRLHESSRPITNRSPVTSVRVPCSTPDVIVSHIRGSRLKHQGLVDGQDGRSRGPY